MGPSCDLKITLQVNLLCCVFQLPAFVNTSPIYTVYVALLSFLLGQLQIGTAPSLHTLGYLFISLIFGIQCHGFIIYQQQSCLRW